MSAQNKFSGQRMRTGGGIRSFGGPWLAVGVVIAFCTGAIAADQNWSTVVTHRDADDYVPPSPVPAIRPVPMKPAARADLLPKSAYASAEDQREVQILNAAGGRTSVRLAPIETAAAPAKAAPAKPAPAPNAIEVPMHPEGGKRT
jgi:hypothetical protein